MERRQRTNLHGKEALPYTIPWNEKPPLVATTLPNCWAGTAAAAGTWGAAIAPPCCPAHRQARSLISKTAGCIVLSVWIIFRYYKEPCSHKLSIRKTDGSGIGRKEVHVHVAGPLTGE